MKISVRTFPYIFPEKFFSFIYKSPYSVYMDVFWNRNEKFTLISYEPFLIFKSKRNEIEINESGKIKKFNGKPLMELQKIFTNLKINFQDFFLPGGIGFISYDFGWQIENLPDIARDDLSLPEVLICFYKNFIIFDHVNKKVIFISLDSSLNENLSFIKSLIKKSKSVKFEKKNFKLKKISANMSKSYYISSIEKIRNYIKEGDVYQINFSHRFEIEGEFFPYEIFLKLKKINPAPFSAYFNCIDFTLISNSPELFLKKYKDKIMTEPMKGTRRRTGNYKIDKKMEIDLLSSEKDRAELIMIVDLERNDLGKICEYGTVKVKKLINLEKYKTVYQTTSIVEGKLKKGIVFSDIIKAMFPGGSITGAPKKRAMEIIEELEPTKRSFYTGCFGYFGLNENLQLNILIRTLVLKNGKIYYPVGGGIVWDSHPEKEFEETITKARNLFLTLGIKDEEIERNIAI